MNSIKIFVPCYLWFRLDQSEVQTLTNLLLLMDEALASFLTKQLFSDLVPIKGFLLNTQTHTQKISMQDSLLASLPPTKLLTEDALQARHG